MDTQNAKTFLDLYASKYPNVSQVEIETLYELAFALWRQCVKLKYPHVKLGLTVLYQGSFYLVVGGDVSGKTHLQSKRGNETVDVYCDWSECEVSE